MNTPQGELSGNGGYDYFYSKEDIVKYIGMPTDMKLRWLEEANRFLFETMSSESRKIWQQVRRGELKLLL